MALFKLNFYLENYEGLWLQLIMLMAAVREVDVVHCSNIFFYCLIIVRRICLLKSN